MYGSYYQKQSEVIGYDMIWLIDIILQCTYSTSAMVLSKYYGVAPMKRIEGRGSKRIIIKIMC